jgi:hypothetical protein
MRLGVGVLACTAVLATVMLALTSCGSSTHVPHATAQAYLRKLSAEQNKLAAAERRIPRRASSPAALASAIALLAGAVHRLERDLAAIDPPKPVSSLHARLVSVAHDYAQQLGQAARSARRPGGELAAAQALTSATHTASSAFSRSVASITSKLKRS